MITNIVIYYFVEIFHVCNPWIPRSDAIASLDNHNPVPRLNVSRLELFTNQFREVFVRADQRERFLWFLQGLLDGVHPKNAEAIAGRVQSRTPATAIDQALQHFLSSSPWDTNRFLACVRMLQLSNKKPPTRIWVIQDVVFPKRGRFSVGTQRQFARPLAKKLNCQVAIAVSELNSHGFYPLAMRLYLPAYWLREHGELARRLVPPEECLHYSKIDIAIRLLNQLRSEGWAPDYLTADHAYLTSSIFADAVEKQNIQLIQMTTPEGVSIEEDKLLDRYFQGSRTLQQGGILFQEEKEKLELDTKIAIACLKETDLRFNWLKTHLGLDQFEGRNWVGWHHHIALVFAAYAFLVSESSGADVPPFSYLSTQHITT